MVDTPSTNQGDGVRNFKLKSIQIVAGLIISSLALIVIIGWYTHKTALVQIFPSLVPMQYNTALTFLFCSIAFLALIYEHLKIARFTSLMVLLISLLTMAQYIFNVNFGIDQLFVKPFTIVQTSHPGRMSPITSLCFIFIGTSLLSLNTLVPFRYRTFVIEALGVSTLVLSLMALFGYLTGIRTYGWSNYTKMAVHTAMCFTILTIGIFARLFEFPIKEQEQHQIKHRKSLFVGIGAFLVFLSLWQALGNQERVALEGKIKSQTESIKLFIDSQIKTREDALIRMAKRREIRFDMPKEEWEADAKAYLAGYQGFQAIEWVDSSYIVRWIMPREGNESAQDFNLSLEPHRKEALERSKENKQVMFTQVVELKQGGRGFLLYVPIYSNNNFSGFILGVFRVSTLFRFLLQENNTLGLSINIYDNQKLFYQNNSNQQYDESLGYETTLTRNGINWGFQVYPSSGYVAENSSFLPSTLLVIGVLISFLLSLTTYLIEISKLHNQEIIEVNKNLLQQVTARKLLEKNEARLLAILELTTDFIGTITSKGQMVYLNQSARVAYGLSQKEDCSKINIQDVHPTEMSKFIVEEAIPSAVKQGTWMGETIVKTKDSQQIPVSQLLIVHKSVDGELEFVSTIMRDITERIRVEKELKTAKEKAEAATQAKAEFLANMSHEIRTPMNAVIGLTGLLLDTSLTIEQRDFVETIRASGDSLLVIINDILDFSKIEAGKLSLELQPFDLRKCIEQSLDLLAAKATEKGLELAYLIDNNTPTTIISDVTRLRQILVNLLGNAVKFTSKGEVLISVTVKENIGDSYVLYFSIKDTGIGIPKERQDTLFQSFSQVDTSTTRKYGGTGLGLAISKHLCGLMGGTMWVESSIGQGANFQFTLQAKFCPSEKQIYLQSVQPQLVGKRILIVDDNTTNRTILIKQTQSWGMIPIALDSGKDAIQELNQGLTIDIAILDMHMPEMDGLTLAIEIREIYRLKKIPLVLLSSQGGNLDFRAKQVDFSATLIKPIKQSQLYDVLVNIFAKTIDKKPRIDGLPKLSHSEPNLATTLPLRILLAEDNVVNQKVAIQILKRMGYRVDLAANGLEAIESLKRQTYDVILMDVQMPEMDGLEATRQICQQWPKEKRPRIIAMTAGAMQGDKEMCLSIGMDDYVTKPIDVAELRASLEKCSLMTKIEAKVLVQTPTRYKVLDLSILNELRQLQDADDPNLVDEVIGDFLINVKNNLVIINQAIKEDNAKELEFAAHSLKSSSGTIGAKQMAQICTELEFIARKGITTSAYALYLALQEEFGYVGEALENQRNKS